LKRYVADVDLAREVPFLPPRQAESGKKVAIVGAGPTGLAAAYYLLQQGHACTVFDEHDEPGGMLRYGIPASALPRDVLDAEIAIIKKLGAEFRMQTKIGEKIPVGGLQDEFDAVFLAIGEIKGGSANAIGLKVTARGIEADARTYETALGGIFAGGSAVRPSKLAVRAVAEGHAAATAIGQYLSGASVTGSRRPFSTHIGRLQEGEMEIFMADASEAERVVPAGGDDAGFSDQEARLEAARCLHCDCRKAEACKLRQYSEAYEAGRSRYKGQRKLFQQDCRHPDIIYEPGKCVVCGMCIRIADSAREPLGLTFIGRGFDVKVGVPFNHSIAEGLRDVAAQCAAACPTGALAMKDSSPSEPQEARAEEPA
jgi:ferredoxin